MSPFKAHLPQPYQSSFLVTFGIILTSGIFPSCSHSRPLHLFGPTLEVGAEDYEDVFCTWTRSSQIYQGLDVKMFIDATYHAPEFRRAFAQAFPDVYGHGGDVTRRELVELTDNVEQYHTFFLSVHTPVIKWNDLERDDSIWRLRLTSSNQASVAPSKILPVKIDENLRVVYPHIDRFDQAYLVRFPLSDSQGQAVLAPGIKDFRLRIASALGNAELSWKISNGREN